jgi:hypothetical protein
VSPPKTSAYLPQLLWFQRLGLEASVFAPPKKNHKYLCRFQPAEKGFTLPRIYKPFTDHTSSEMFGRIYLMKSGEIAREISSLSLHMRLFLLGLQRVSNRGHAPFQSQEIQQLLKKKDGTPYDERQIRNEISRMATQGVLSPASNIRCLLFPMELISLKTDKKNAAKCPEHGTHSSWSGYNNDWASDYPPVGVVEEAIVPLVENHSGISLESVGDYSIGDGTYDSY